MDFVSIELHILFKDKHPSKQTPLFCYDLKNVDRSFHSPDVSDHVVIMHLWLLFLSVFYNAKWYVMFTKKYHKFYPSYYISDLIAWRKVQPCYLVSSKYYEIEKDLLNTDIIERISISLFWISLVWCFLYK